MVGLRTTSGDYFVVKLARQRKVGEAVAMDVTHLLLAIPILCTAEPMRKSFYSGPGRDRFVDPGSRSLHPF